MIDLRELRRVLVDEIGKAETRVVKSVHMSLPRAKEDDITALFVVEAERCLEDATKSGGVAFAVRTDLENAYRSQGRVPPKRLVQVSDGLVARVRKQGPAEEVKTGGDFGLLFVEPRFDLRWDAHLDLRRCGLKRGLLVQAKRRLRGGRWNQFTSTQLSRLPRRMTYTALLRYEFADAGGRQLKSFEWHPLSGFDISGVAEWLRSGEFPSAVNTSAVVAGVSRGEYGTDDQAIIERDICPDAGSYVVIEVDWQDGKNPESLVAYLNRQLAERVVRQGQQVHLIRRG